MKSSKNPRFLLSTFAAAMIVFAWTGDSHADLWVAQGFDANNVPVTVDLDVTTHGSSGIEIAISNHSVGAEAMTDIVINTNHPLTAAFFSGLTLWEPVFTSTSTTYTATLTYNPTENNPIGDGGSGTLTITGAPLNTEVTNLKVSMGTHFPPNEISATLSTPEPSSMILAAFGALGFLGYKLRRRIAK